MFYFVLLQSKKNKSLPDSILAIWMLVIGIHLGNFYLYSEGYWETYPHLIGIALPFPFLYGPLLYLYTQYSLHGFKTFRKKDLTHFIPTFLTYIYMIEFYFFYSEDQKRLVDSGELSDFDHFSTLLLVGFIISGLTYSIYSNYLLNKYRTLVNDNFSNSDEVDLNWLKSFIIGVGLLFITVILVSFTTEILDITYPFNPDIILYVVLVIAILFLGYFGIRHKNIFVDNELVTVEEKSTASYEKSSLKDDVAMSMHENLIQLIENEKLFLEPKLTLISLANRLEISTNHLSQIINQFEKQNFNDFINKYRVEEFINRATKDPHFSLLALALDSGFSSKSTFNAVFKKHKGVTPSQFLSTLSRQ